MKLSFRAHYNIT